MSLAVRADVSALATVNLVVVEVTAPDIPRPVAFNVTIVRGVASGTVQVPAGFNRTFTVTAFDTGGVATHRGSILAAVTEGSNLTLTLSLDALQGDQPIEAHIGSIIVDVEPEARNVSVGDTVRLSAIVVDASNDTLDVQVRWATLSPSLAWVDIAGLVTAIGPV